MIGTCLQDRYTLRTVLSQRNDRQTYLAWDSQCQREVVVKVLPFTYGFDWDDLKHFERESNLLRQLSHPMIPEYLDGFEINQPDFKGFAWVQSYISADSLATHIQQGRTFSEADIQQLATALLSVLSFLHERNPTVIHRDIKPSNILLAHRSEDGSEETFGKVYLIDFGAIQTCANQTEGTITVAGTFGYGAPEQFRGEAIPASDLYGLGMTLVYLLTGVEPTRLPMRNGRVIFEAHQLSPHFTDWIKGLIQPDVNRRFGSATEALCALRDHTALLPQLGAREHQPVDSQLVLSKTSQVLRVRMPKIGLTWRNVVHGTGMILLSLGLVSMWAIPLVGWVIAFVSFKAVMTGWRDIAIATFGYGQLTVTPSELRWVMRWRFLKKEDRIATADIDQLALISPHVVVSQYSETDTQKYCPKELRIHTGEKYLKLTAPVVEDQGFKFLNFRPLELIYK